MLGFGGRSLDQKKDTTKMNPKYLNSPETATFKKNQVLFGMDMARKAISLEGCAGKSKSVSMSMSKSKLKLNSKI